MHDETSSSQPGVKACKQEIETLNAIILPRRHAKFRQEATEKLHPWNIYMPPFSTRNRLYLLLGAMSHCGSPAFAVLSQTRTKVHLAINEQELW